MTLPIPPQAAASSEASDVPRAPTRRRGRRALDAALGRAPRAAAAAPVVLPILRPRGRRAAPLVLDDEAPSLGAFATPEFFRVLTCPYREVYWAVLVTLYHRKFAATVALTRPDAIGVAERLLEEAAFQGVDLGAFAWEEGPTLTDLTDDAPTMAPWRAHARRVLRVLEDGGWFSFQDYAEERYPVLELAVHGQRLIAHLLRDMTGQRLPLLSFADRLGELVNHRCSAMHATPGRLKQLRDIVMQMRERIQELLGSIKQQSDGVFQRAHSIRSILQNLLTEFEQQVGADYALLKRKESPPRLWTAVTQAVDDLGRHSIWLSKEARWYFEQGTYADFDAAEAAVQEDLTWIATAMDALSLANAQLDQRYARYVSVAQRRVQAQLRQGANLADGIHVLLEAAARGVPLTPIEMVRFVTIAPVGFTALSENTPAAAAEPLPDIPDLTEAEARAERARLDDSIPIGSIRRWMDAAPEDAIEVSVDDLPLATQDDYVRHIHAGWYATHPRSGVTFRRLTCGSCDDGCDPLSGCPVCTRVAHTPSGALRVPRGVFTLAPVPRPLVPDRRDPAPVLPTPPRTP